MLLGQKVEIDDSLEWRVKWGQRGVGVNGLLALICWIASRKIASIRIVFIVFMVLAFIFVCVLYYKNFSLVIAKRLVRETHVVMILVLALCNWSIDIMRPVDSLSAVNGLIYVLAVSAFVFLDAVK